MDRTVLYPLGIWALMAGFAVLNGGIRETAIIPRTGDYVGHVISTALLIGVILVVTYLFFTNTALEYRRAQLVAIGLGWVVLTVGFEFLVGYLEGTPVSVTIAQYDILAGNVWIFVPLTLLFAPLLFGSVLAD